MPVRSTVPSKLPIAPNGIEIQDIKRCLVGDAASNRT